MKNWKKLIVTAAAFGSLALLAGCTTASAVSLEEAKDLVKDQMGDRNAVVLEQETDREDGVYELEIVIDGVHYDFEVDSRTGQVREMERESVGVSAAPAETVPAETAPVEIKPAETAPAETKPAEKSISLEEAKAIAYAHAGVSESEAYDRSYEADDGRYEIDFDHGGYAYEYDISYEGKILKSHREKDHDHHDHHDTPAASETRPAETKPTEQSQQRISAQEALSIAMGHAGVSDARDKEAEWDDGRWEVSFESGRTEYEYHISAEGKVLRWEEDRD
ncbi:MAG: PepSY domain-containing protein [Oscillospiraceae bacterium]|nr:PepSY domain-containing protein [Oscillospiraceae bacterium]